MRYIEWDNIDFENKLITIDPSVMKSRKLHVVPMSTQVIDILEFLQPITGRYNLVFTGRSNHNQAISENTVLGVIRRIGYSGRASGHGFRHQFSTVLNEAYWHKDSVEAQLAHVNSEGTRGIYNHAKHLNNRREMMQWWADWIDKLVVLEK